MFKDIKQVMKDSVLYGIGNVAVKLVGFILIPLYTDAEYFSTADYGLMGLLEVTSQILIAVMGLSLYSGLIGMPNTGINKRLFFSPHCCLRY